MISHRFKTIFVHVPKAAGQSVEAEFVRAHGLTWETRGELLLGRNIDPALGPPRLAHLYASEYVPRGHVDQASFDSYFKFAVVRDPYARAVSEYNMRYPYRTCSFRRFLESQDPEGTDAGRHRDAQVRYVLGDDGRQLVDTVVRFERLATDLPPLLSERLGRPVTMPHRNAARGWLTLKVSSLPQRLLDLIYRTYEADFDHFRYPRRVR